MVKTQIQIPDELYRRVKQLAAAQEWSLAETFRRAVEQMFERYPSTSERPDAWRVPKIRPAGWQGLSASELHRRALDDLDQSRGETKSIR
jgi:predicted DNA-binding protein